MNKNPVAFIPLALFLLLAAALMVAVIRSGNEVPAPSRFASHINDTAPLTDLPPLVPGAAGYSTADWKGGAYLVNFFASWCVPCRAEHALLMRLTAEKIPVVGIAYKDRAEAISAFLKQFGDPFHLVVTDADGRAAIDWGITGVPETFLIDADGRIRFHQAGPLTETVITNRIIPLWREVVR